MKAFIILFAVTLGLISSVNANEIPEDFKQEITNNIAYPEFAKENMIEGEVWMKVSLSENSEVKIVDLSATNQDLGEFVKSELKNLTIKNTSIQTDDIYLMKVKFELIK